MVAKIAQQGFRLFSIRACLGVTRIVHIAYGKNNFQSFSRDSAFGVFALLFCGGMLSLTLANLFQIGSVKPPAGPLPLLECPKRRLI